VIAKGGPVEGFLLQAPVIRPQHPDKQWVVDTIPVKESTQDVTIPFVAVNETQRD
jgi:hypothetical protein